MGRSRSPLPSRLHHGRPYPALRLPGRHWPRFSSRLHHCRHQSKHYLLALRWRHPSARPRHHCSSPRVVRTRSLRHPRFLHQPFHLARHRHHAHGRPPPHVSRIRPEHCTSVPLLGHLSLVVHCAPHPERNTGTHLHFRRSPQHLVAPRPLQIPIRAPRARLLRLADPRRHRTHSRPAPRHAPSSRCLHHPLHYRHHSSGRRHSFQVLRHEHCRHLARRSADAHPCRGFHSRSSVPPVGPARRAAHIWGHAHQPSPPQTLRSPLATPSHSVWTLRANSISIRLPTCDQLPRRRSPFLCRLSRHPTPLERSPHFRKRRRAVPRPFLSRRPHALCLHLARVPQFLDRCPLGRRRVSSRRSRLHLFR